MLGISLFYLIRSLILNLDVHFFQTSFKAFEEVFDILRNDGSQRAQTECRQIGNLSRIDRESSFVYLVVNLGEIPVRIVWIQNGNNQFGL